MEERPCSTTGCFISLIPKWILTCNRCSMDNFTTSGMFLAVDQYWKGSPVNPGWEELWMKMMDKESRYILSLLSLLGSLSDNKTVTMEGIHSW